MATAFKLLASNTAQVVTLPGGTFGSSAVYLQFLTPPSAGTVTVEARRVGSAAWTPLTKALAASIISGELAVRVDGFVAALRVTFAGLVGGTEPTLYVASEENPIGLFTGLAAVTTQNYPEANIKNGLQFFVRAAWPSADPIVTGEAGSRLLSFTTGVKPVLVKFRELTTIAEELRLRLFANPTGLAGGTVLAVGNYNGANPVASTVQVRKNVTVTALGTEFNGGDPEYSFGESTSGSRSSVTIPQGRDRILLPNTTYLVQFTNLSSGGGSTARAIYAIDWYEGGTDLPL